MLVTLEGLDGSGKTTVLDRLDDEFPEATQTREPTDSWYGKAVGRSIDDDTADPLAELFLYVADHAAHLSEVIRPALQEESLVISDRYSDSRYAYQGATLSDSSIDDPMSYIQAVHEPFTRKPDLTFYLDIDPQTAVERSGQTNKFEQEVYLEEVEKNYEQLIDAEPQRFIRIDATQTIGVVCDQITQQIRNKI